MGVEERAQVLAEVVRGGVVESVHHGHLVGLDAGGALALRRGDPDVAFFGRSSLKPLQAVAMLRAGLDLDGQLLALACASHSGEDGHVNGVRRILASAGLTETDLQNTAGMPLGADAAAARHAADVGPSSLAQNCSGKHAAMLATCVAAGWDPTTYRDPDHPLQRALRDTVRDLTGDGADAVTVDGCGAPLFSCTLAGLARAFATIATAREDTPQGRVAAAIRAYPWWVGGTGRAVTRLVDGVPGLVAKDGAEGVFAAALPDGRAFALKVLDGSARPPPVIATAALRAFGVDSPVLDAVGRVDVLGHGTPVGMVRALAGEPLRSARARSAPTRNLPGAPAERSEGAR